MAPPAAELAIAKASLSAVLFRPDPSSCSRDEIEQFHGLLSETISRCSPTNVQKCKQWALQHLVRSPTRAGALGRYLVALANTYTLEASAKSPRPSAKRRRLHILYILNDIFHHVKLRLGDDTFIKGIETHLISLVKSAASFSKCPKHIRKIETVLDIWDDKGYVSPQLIKDLRRAVEEAPGLAAGADQNGTKLTEVSNSNNKAKEAPFVMPSMHGDAATPWFDLPAANWLPVIEPNSTRPMNPAMIRPLQLASGPPDRDLVDAVKKLLADVDKIYAKDIRLDGDMSVDIGQTGELFERDEINGDIVSGDTYYGWSRAFCQKMKARRSRGDSDEPRGRVSSRSRSRSLSRDRSSSRGSPHPAFKRRRLSSTSRSGSRDARRDNYRDVSGSRSRSRSRSRQRSYSRPGFQGASRSYSRSRSPPSRRNVGREFDAGPPSRSPHYSPPPSMAPGYGNNGQFNQPPHHPPPPNMPPIPPPQAGYGSWNAPPPPPPPPPGGYQGQWPPPPPPGGPSQQNWYPPNPNQWAGAWPPPPPPPPQAPQHQGGYQYGRGGGGGGGYRGGRGGYNNRGRGW